MGVGAARPWPHSPHRRGGRPNGGRCAQRNPNGSTLPPMLPTLASIEGATPTAAVNFA